MSSTSQKHRNFVSEPMAEKEVTELAGIGEALGGRLCEKGFDKVSCYHRMKQYEPHCKKTGLRGFRPGPT